MGMFNNHPADGVPTFVWSIDADRKVYEAKLGRPGYHGYLLEEEDNMRGVVLKEWAKRCQAN